jgi:Core-2/I-Branching enzyme
VSVTIGFAILSYNHPQQLRRLTNTLTSMFDAPIVCNHDFTQCALNEKDFPPTVHFVRPHVEMKWGHISCPLAALRAFGLLNEYARPDWFVLLSGSDYPVRSAADILNTLSCSEYDAFLTSREIRYGESALFPARSAQLHALVEQPGWSNVAYNRYCAYRIPWRLPSYDPTSHFRVRTRDFLIRNPKLIRMIPWAKQCPLAVYAGEFWFQARRGAIERLLDPSMDRLVSYYYDKYIPEEAIFHTMLRNQVDLRIGEGKRYVDWPDEGPSPKWLDIPDLPLIVASGAHFARKFRPDGTVQDVIDEALLKL